MRKKLGGLRLPDTLYKYSLTPEQLVRFCSHDSVRELPRGRTNPGELLVLCHRPDSDDHSTPWTLCIALQPEDYLAQGQFRRSGHQTFRLAYQPRSRGGQYTCFRDRIREVRGETAAL